MGPAILQAATLLQVLSALLPVSVPPAGLDECFFFNSLVVGLLYSLVFCQFWLFFVFKFVVVLLLLCEEAQCVYLGLHLGHIYRMSLKGDNTGWALNSREKTYRQRRERVGR